MNTIIVQGLHQNGYSTRQIAELLHEKKNSVLVHLRNKGVLRKSLGVDFEQRIADWLIERGHAVIHERGDAPFDLLVDGQRVDIKSAGKGGNGRYYFQLQDLDHRKHEKDLEREVDWFYLVFKDEIDTPVFAIKSSDIKAKQTLSLKFNSTKYPIYFIGFLES